MSDVFTSEVPTADADAVHQEQNQNNGFYKILANWYQSIKLVLTIEVIERVWLRFVTLSHLFGERNRALNAAKKVSGIKYKA